MRVICLDFETYFDGDYTLKKLTTEGYIRDPRFQAHMMGYWEPARMAAPAECLPAVLATDEEFRATIAGAAVLAHYAHFDGLILEHHYGIRPAFWFDTLSMARLVLPGSRSHSLDALAAHFALPAKAVPYNDFRGVRMVTGDLYERLAFGCRHDVWLTWQIFQKLLPHVRRDELKVISTTVKMFTEPCLTLDVPRMTAFLKAERIRKAKAMLAVGQVFGWREPQTGPEILSQLEQIETELQSADKFKIALASLGYKCPMKWSDKQEIEIPALARNDDGMKELLEHEDHRVQALAAARLGVKSTIDESRACRLIETSQRGALPVYLAYAAAKTLRFGGGDKTNWQNFRRGGEIRQSILAPAGHQLVIGDLSQIEYRLLLWVTGQTDKLQALASGIDLYCEFASKFYGEPVVKDDKPRRGVGKQGILMGGYGAGSGTMIATAAGGGYGPPVFLSADEGQRMVDLYRSEHPCVTTFWKWCESALGVLASGYETFYAPPLAAAPLLAIKDHRIWLPNGTCLNYEGLRWATNAEIFPDQTDDGQGFSWWQPVRKGYSRIWGSKLTADIIQALACAVIKDVWVRMMGHGYNPALQVHDELVFAVPELDAPRILDLLLDEMEEPPAWCADIPLAAEGIVSERYEK